MNDAALSRRVLELSPQPLTPPEAVRLPVSNVALWFGALGAPTAWALQLMLMYPMVEVACRLQSKVPLYVTSGLLFLIAALSALVSLHYMRVMRRHDGATVPRRARFMARAGLYGAVLFLIIIASMTLPVLFDDPCQLQGRRRPTLLPHL